MNLLTLDNENDSENIIFRKDNIDGNDITELKKSKMKI